MKLSEYMNTQKVNTPSTKQPTQKPVQPTAQSGNLSAFMTQNNVKPAKISNSPKQTPAPMQHSPFAPQTPSRGIGLFPNTPFSPAQLPTAQPTKLEIMSNMHKPYHEPNPSLLSRIGNVVSGAVKDTTGSLLNIGAMVADPFTELVDKDGTTRDIQAQYAKDQISIMKKELADYKTSGFRKKILQKSIKDMEVLLHDDGTLKSASDRADDFQVSSAEDISVAKQGLGKVGSFGVDVGVGAAQLAGDIRIAAATGGTALLPMAARSFGGSAQDARRSGANLGQQVAYGGLSAATSLLVEKISNVGGALSKAYGKGAMDEVLEAATNKAIAKFISSKTGQAVAQRAIGAGMSGLGEGLEEVIESTLDPLYKKITYDPDAKWNAEEILYDGLIGGAIGLIAGGNPNNNRQANRSAQDVVQPPSAIAPAPQGVASQPAQLPTVNQNAIDIKVPTETENAVQGIVEPATAIEPMAKPEAVASSTGTPYTATLYHGSGAEASKIYNGIEYPVAGQGKYYATSEKAARHYGDNVEAVDVHLENPIVIKDDADWRKLTSAAGWQYSNMYSAGKDAAIAASNNLRKYILSTGHDGLVIEYESNHEGDINIRTGNTVKTLDRVFSHDQIVDYNEENAEQSDLAPLNKMPEMRGSAENNIEPVSNKEAIKNGEQSNDYALSEEEWNSLLETEPTPQPAIFPENSIGAKITKGMPQGTGAASKGLQSVQADQTTGGIENGRTEITLPGKTGSNILRQGSEQNVPQRQSGELASVSGGTTAVRAGWRSVGVPKDSQSESLKYAEAVTADTILPEAKKDQTVYRDVSETDAVRRSHSLAKKNGYKVDAWGGGEISLEAGGTIRAFAIPGTDRIGVQTDNNEIASEDLTRHEIMEQKILRGEVSADEVLSGAEQYVDSAKIQEVIEFYHRGYPSESIGHARSELVCDGADHINQLRYDVEQGILGNDFKAFADLIDEVIGAINRTANEMTNGAFELDGDMVQGAETDSASDTKFSGKIQAVDSDGKKLTPEQAEFFKDSKVRDEDGKLMVVYHGTDADFTVFDRTKSRANMDIQGNFFSPWKDDARGYGANVRKLYLNIKNPASESVGYKALNRFKGQNNAGVKARDYLITLNYDGVNNGGEEYIAFSPEQIKSVDNKTPTSDPDIRYSGKVKPVSQNFTSADTSLPNQLPALFTNSHVLFVDGGMNIDIGAGKTQKPKAYVKNKGSDYLPFDPYNRSKESNTETLNWLRAGNRADTVTCANVLNVIDTAEGRSNTILEAAKALKPNGVAYFTTHEGNTDTNRGKKAGDGIARQTGKDKFQNFRTTESYVSEVREWFDNVERRGPAIIAKEPKSNLPKAAWEVARGEAVRYSSKITIFPESSLGAKMLPQGTGAKSSDFAPTQKTSKVFTNTFQKTESLTAEQKAQMKPEDYQYDVIGHAQNETAAHQRVDVDYEGEVADLKAKQEWTGEDVFTSEKILNKISADAEKSGDYAEMNKWTKAIQERGTRGGQTVEAFKAFQKTPEGAVIKAQQVVSAAETKLTTKTENGKKVKTAIGRKISSDVDNVTKVVDAIVNGRDTKGMAKTLNKVTLKDVKALVASGTYDADAINDLVRSKYGIPTLTSADVQKIYELNKLAEETGDDYQKRVYLNQAARVISDKLPVTGKQKVLAIRRIAMLLNPKTLISRNAGGNVVFGILENLKDAPGTLIDLAISKKTGVRSTSYNPFATSKAEFIGMKKGLTEWGKDIKNDVDTSPTEHEMPRSHALKSKVGEGTEKALYRLLQLGDRPFYEAAYAKRIDELKRLGLDYTSEDANGQAMAYALDKVFQNNSELSKKAVQLRDSLGVLGDIAIPFAQTPANIFDKLADYSPYGYVRTIKKAGSIKDSAWSQKQFVDTLSRSMTGTGIIALAFFAAKSGLISGGEDKGEDEALTYQKKISGWQPYSIVVGDKSYTYDWATVVGALLSLGADISKADNAGDTLSAILSAGAKAGINTMFNQSYLEGVSELFGGEDISSGLESMLMGLPASFTPTAFQQIAKIIDPIARDTYDSDPLKRAWNKVKAKLPYISKSLPAKVGASGEELTNYQGSKLSNAFEGVLSPGFIGETQKTAIDTEMQRLSDATGATDVLPNWSKYTSKSDLSFTGNGTKYTMTAKEWETYQKSRGQYSYKELNKLTKSAEYKSMTDEQKAEAVTDIYSAATANARMTTVEARGEMYIPNADAGAKIEKYQSAGITKKQAYSVYKSFESLKPEEGEKQVTTYQKVKAISGFGYSDEQAIALAGTLYTTKDDDGAIKKESLLPYLNTSKHLLSLYLTNKDSEMISMTIPETFTSKKVEYTLDDAEKELFKSTYVNYFNAYITNVSGAKTIKSLRDKAYNAAKTAVIQSR